MTDLITITGNLGAAPEQKTLANGVTVTNFRVGSTHRRFDKPTGQWVDAWTSWYQVSAYRALGENAYACLHKGDRVIVTGSLRVREWDNGTRRGLAVELDATALGHDLMWGTTAFRKTARAQGGDPSPASAEYPVDDAPVDTAPTAAAITDAGGWAIPAATTASVVDIPAESEVPTPPHPGAPELVDTPF